MPSAAVPQWHNRTIYASQRQKIISETLSSLALSSFAIHMNTHKFTNIILPLAHRVTTARLELATTTWPLMHAGQDMNTVNSPRIQKSNDMMEYTMQRTNNSKMTKPGADHDHITSKMVHVILWYSTSFAWLHPTSPTKFTIPTHSGLCACMGHGRQCVCL